MIRISLSGGIQDPARRASSPSAVAAVDLGFSRAGGRIGGVRGGIAVFFGVPAERKKGRGAEGARRPASREVGGARDSNRLAAPERATQITIRRLAGSPVAF